MDFASLKDKVTNLSLYDIKAGVRQVQNGESHTTGVEAVANAPDSRHELHRDGGEGAGGYEQ